MKQKLHIHIGYHKTGTTSLQKKLASSNLDFNFIGRRYNNPESDDLLQNLAKAVTFNNESKILSHSNTLISKIFSENYANNLISHENLLRPMDSCFSGLNFLIKLLKEHFDVEIFVSTREKSRLVLSRFTHDMRILHDANVHPKLPFFVVKAWLKVTLTRHFDCSYPYCKQKGNQCNCGMIKRIPLDFYDLDLVEQKINTHINRINIFDGETSGMLFGENIFPLPRLNEAKITFSTKQKDALLRIIEKKIKNT